MTVQGDVDFVDKIDQIFVNMLSKIQKHINTVSLPMMSDIFCYDIPDSIKTKLIDMIQNKVNEIVDTVQPFKCGPVQQIADDLIKKELEINSLSRQLNDYEAQNTHLTIMVQTYSEQIVIFQKDVRLLQQRIKKLLLVKKENRKITGNIGMIYKPDEINMPELQLSKFSLKVNQSSELENDSAVLWNDQFSESVEANDEKKDELLQYYMDKCSKMESAMNLQKSIQSTQTYGSLLHKSSQTEPNAEVQMLQQIIYELTQKEIRNISSKGTADIKVILKQLQPEGILKKDKEENNDLKIKSSHQQDEMIPKPFNKPKLNFSGKSSNQIKREQSSIDVKNKAKEKLKTLKQKYKNTLPLEEQKLLFPDRESFNDAITIPIADSQTDLIHNTEKQNQFFNTKIKQAILQDVSIQQTDISLMGLDLDKIILQAQQYEADVAEKLKNIATVDKPEEVQQKAMKFNLKNQKKMLPKIEFNDSLQQKIVKENASQKIANNSIVLDESQKEQQNQLQSEKDGLIIGKQRQTDIDFTTDKQGTKNIKNSQRQIDSNKSSFLNQANQAAKQHKKIIHKQFEIYDEQQEQFKWEQNIKERQLKELQIIHQQNGYIYPKLDHTILNDEELYVIQNGPQPANKNEKFAQVFSCDCNKIQKLIDQLKQQNENSTYLQGVIRQYDILYSDSNLKQLPNRPKKPVTSQTTQTNDLTDAQIVEISFQDQIQSQKPRVHLQQLTSPQRIKDQRSISQFSIKRTPFEVRQLENITEKANRVIAQKLKQQLTTKK